ncbi:helix-turn-helix domain-containing protein [Streptomyces sp. G1]|uniref:helix-turn-helix domain-containing protein n=1 Tax=Streptomyces sp. G1 TaxID=361572 RepID=UPI00202E9B03|nr:helix-turn-helix transcriptional regulator [Streptomyces sp. G1]MCM1968007.1 helix-turn-helix transcriptional regulator [Streptomyces sp. G1]
MAQENEAQGPLAVPGAGEVMGLGGLLRGWRAAAGSRLGRTKPLSQVEVALRAGISDRRYRQYEKGAVPGPDTVDRLARALLLGPDERQALFYYAGGVAPSAPATSLGDTPARRSLELLLTLQMPRPAYISDASWNIAATNKAMADWFPWVLEPGANLMRWALLHRDARVQLSGWDGHARSYLAMLRMALAQRKNDLALTSLLRELLEDPDCRRMWNESPQVASHRDGDRFRLLIPRFHDQPLEVVSHVLVPASYPDLRFVVITWLDDDPDLVSSQSHAEPEASVDGYPLEPSTPSALPPDLADTEAVGLYMTRLRSSLPEAEADATAELDAQMEALERSLELARRLRRQIPNS